ncbi:MAG: A/G-specific adenine glycosylase [Acidimicrobiales bacterium]
MSSDLTAEVASAVLAWGEAARRDLPWRRTRDPWAVLVSELMLQQTQVSRVLAKYHEFLDSYPTPAACASAPLADVIRRWSGLGYNRRAVSLHASACMIMQDFSAQVPNTLPALRRLRGVGAYTARAVLAFAFEAEVAVVDTNIARVLARMCGRSLTAKEVQTAADAALERDRPWEWNQSLMDLGATLCTARQPRCTACPLAPECVWRGGHDLDPAEGSAGVSGGQSRFEGSDRQGRGRLVRALGAAPVTADDLSAVMGWPADPERATRVAATLVDDGLVRVVDRTYQLPG